MNAEFPSSHPPESPIAGVPPNAPSATSPLNEEESTSTISRTQEASNPIFSAIKGGWNQIREFGKYEAPKELQKEHFTAVPQHLTASSFVDMQNNKEMSVKAKKNMVTIAKVKLLATQLLKFTAGAALVGMGVALIYTGVGAPLSPLFFAAGGALAFHAVRQGITGMQHLNSLSREFEKPGAQIALRYEKLVEKHKVDVGEGYSFEALFVQELQKQGFDGSIDLSNPNDQLRVLSALENAEKGINYVAELPAKDEAFYTGLSETIRSLP